MLLRFGFSFVRPDWRHSVYHNPWLRDFAIAGCGLLHEPIHRLHQAHGNSNVPTTSATAIKSNSMKWYLLCNGS